MADLLRRACAWTALVAFSASLGLGWTASSHQDEADGGAPCEQIELADGHASAQFEPVRPSPADTHCTVCHWQRAISGAKLAAAGGGVFALRAIGPHAAADHRAPRAAAPDSHSSRAPPASHI